MWLTSPDLAPLVGADLDVMSRDAIARRGHLPIAFTSLVEPNGAREVADWVLHQLDHWQTNVGV